MSDPIERRARALSALFTQIVLGVGAAGCSPPPPTDVPDARQPEPEPQPPAPTESASASVSAAPPSPPRSHVEERPPVMEVGGPCDLGVPKSRVRDGMNMVHGLKPKEPFDYLELTMLGAGEGGDVLMASGKKCATAKDWRTCEKTVARTSLAQGESGFRHGCVPADCFHVLVVTRGDDVSIVKTVEGVKELLGAIDTPSEALLLAYASEYSPKDSHYPRCEMASGKGIKQAKDGTFGFLAEKTIDWCPMR